MSEIKYRLAKPSDAKEIASVHWQTRDRYTNGIFLQLGKGFLAHYYKVILDDPWEVIICAVNENDRIIGFSESTLDAGKCYKNVRKHRLSLALYAMGGIICHPKLLKGVWQRYRSLKGDHQGQQFITTEGARGGYWCWLKSDESLKAFELVKIQGKIIPALGIKEMRFEVDKTNKAVYKYHSKRKGVEVIGETTLPDGRVRVQFCKHYDQD